MAENSGFHGQHLANSHQQQQQQQHQQHQQHQQQQQQQQTRGSRQAPPLPNSPGGYHHQNQQLSFYPQHHHSRPHYYSHQQHFHSHQEYQNPTLGPFAMASMAQSVPRAEFRQPQYATGPQDYAPSGGQPTAPHPQYQGQPGTPMQMQAFYMAQQGAMAARQQYGNPMPGMVPAGPTNMAARPNYVYYPSQPQAPAYYYPQHFQHSGFQNSQGYSQQAAHASHTPAVHHPQRPRSQSTSASGSAHSGGAASRQNSNHRSQKEQSQAQSAAIVRGPPRKPKQSGHAIWIGNLPPQTELMSLVHHVCQKTDGLQSLFLISKSNCAFANFPDDESCQVAQQKVNDTWFSSIRLVSRLRKTSVENAQGITPSPSRPTATATAIATATSAAASAATSAATSANVAVPVNTDGVLGIAENAEAIPERTKKSASPSSLVVDGTGKSTPTPTYDDVKASPPSSSSEQGRKGDRYFILKSLTVEDLALSVRTGIWATQSHNEQVLNSAFNTCDGVYLVFSANKSGEYYGYAKMTSEINNDPAAAVEFAPTSHSFNEIDLPKAIPTDATENTPRGRIIDDSARGTIFWEAQSDDGLVDNPAEDDEEVEISGDGVAERAGGIGGNYGNDGDDVNDVNDLTEAEEAAAGADGSQVGAEKQAATAEKEPAGDGDNGDNGGTGDAKDSVSALDDGAEEPKAWGKPFKLEWQSTVRLPFYRTRGLRNPLNANREVKIARDGTEVDAEVGKKLVGLFHQEAVGSPDPGGRSKSMSFVAGYN